MVFSQTLFKRQAPWSCPATPLSSCREREEACLHAEKSVQARLEYGQSHMSYMGTGRKLFEENHFLSPPSPCCSFRFCGVGEGLQLPSMIFPGEKLWALGNS